MNTSASLARPVPQAEAFDPANWLAQYTALGGVYVANGKLNLCILVNEQTEDELSQIRQLVVDLTEADKSIILAHLNSQDRLTPGCVGPDAVIFAAWECRKFAYTRYNVLPFSDDLAVPYTPAEQREWDTIDTAEEVIRSSIATTPKGVAIQIWAALQHSLDKGWSDKACQSGDLSALEARADELDWNVRLILAALRSLEAMEASA